MFCRYCGAELPTDSSYCPKCGKETSLAPTAAVAPASTAASTPAPTADTGSAVNSGAYFSSGAAAAKRPISKKALFITLAAVVGVVVIGVAIGLGLMAYGNRMPEPNTIVRNDAAIIRVSDGAKISLGMTRKEVEKVLGEGTVEEDNLNGLNYKYLGELFIYYSKGNASAGEETVRSMTMGLNPDVTYKTFRGVGTGTPQAEVEKLYGSKYYQTLDLGEKLNMWAKDTTYDFSTNEYVEFRYSLPDETNRLYLYFLYENDTNNLRGVQIRY